MRCITSAAALRIFLPRMPHRHLAPHHTRTRITRASARLLLPARKHNQHNRLGTVKKAYVKASRWRSGGAYWRSEKAKRHGGENRIFVISAGSKVALVVACSNAVGTAWNGESSKQSAGRK